MLTELQKRNLERAVKASTAMSAANPIGTIDDNQWTESSNIVQLKSNYGTAGCKIGATIMSAAADEEADFENLETNVSWTTGLENGIINGPDKVLGIDLGNFTSISGITTTEAKAACDNDATSRDGLASAYCSQGDSFSLDLGAPTTVSGVQGISDMNGSPPYNRTVLSGKLLVGDAWTELTRFGIYGTVDIPGFDYGDPVLYTFTPMSVQYLKVDIGFLRNTYADKVGIDVYDASGATTLNTATTIELVDGTQSFDPGELYAQIDGAAYTKVDLTGKFNIDYSLDGGTNYTADLGGAGLVDAATFQALDPSIFANLTTLKLKIQPVGEYIINAIRIDTIAGGSILTKTGGITMTVAGVDMIDMQTDGDIVMVGDLSCDDITSSGFVASGVSGDITASSTQEQGQQPLVKSVNVIATCSVAGDAVTLPAAAAGRIIRVINNGAETLQMFPVSGDDAGGGVNAGVNLLSGNNVTLQAIDDTTWEAV